MFSPPPRNNMTNDCEVRPHFWQRHPFTPVGATNFRHMAAFEGDGHPSVPDGKNRAKHVGDAAPLLDCSNGRRADSPGVVSCDFGVCLQGNAAQLLCAGSFNVLRVSSFKLLYCRCTSISNYCRCTSNASNASTSRCDALCDCVQEHRVSDFHQGDP